jgi:hypothetical protein
MTGVQLMVAADPQPWACLAPSSAQSLPRAGLGFWEWLLSLSGETEAPEVGPGFWLGIRTWSGRLQALTQNHPFYIRGRTRQGRLGSPGKGQSVRAVSFFCSPSEKE